MDSTQPVFQGGLSVEGRVWRQMRVGLSYLKQANQGSATIDTEFDLPEVALPKQQHELDGFLQWNFAPTSKMHLSLGISVTQLQSWGLPLAYSSLDGGALFAKRQSEYLGPQIGMTLLSGSSSLVQLVGHYQALDASLSSQDRRIAADLGWRLRWTDYLDTGLHVHFKKTESQRCHADFLVCQREGEVKEVESTGTALLSLGYAVGGI